MYDEETRALPEGPGHVDIFDRGALTKPRRPIVAQGVPVIRFTPMLELAEHRISLL